MKAKFVLFYQNESFRKTHWVEKKLEKIFPTIIEKTRFQSIEK